MDERQWFDRLYHAHIDLLFRLGRRLLPESEDALLDILQEVFLAAWGKRAQLMHHPNPGGWLVEALKFRVMSARTKSQRKTLREAYSLDEEDSAAPVAEKELSPEQSAILAGHMHKLRELLGEENADIFIAWALEGRSAAEIAAAHGLTTSCVWMRISRSRKKLAAHPELFYILLVMLTGFSARSL